MSDVILILESPHTKGQYYRVDFVMDSVRRSGLSVGLFSCGDSHNDDEGTIGWEISQSNVLRLLNLLIYLISLRSFGHFGYLLRMWTSLAVESPAVIVFYNNWTGLFLLFWRKLTGSQARLVWDWFDLNTRMQYHGRKMGPTARILQNLEERIGPSYFDGIIVPTRFAQRLVRSWGQPPSKIHVLGEVRELNPYVDRDVLDKRIAEIRLGGPIQIAWVGVLRQYQLDGLTLFFRALNAPPRSKHRAVIHIVGPRDTSTNGLATLIREMPEEITVRRHDRLSPDGLDRLLARAHIAVHPLPHELFCEFIYSRKMADYLAAALPVAFSAVGGLSEVGTSFGISFHLNDADSVVGAIDKLSDPEEYEGYAVAAWTVAERELSQIALSAKRRALAGFLAKVVADDLPAYGESAT